MNFGIWYSVMVLMSMKWTAIGHHRKSYVMNLPDTCSFLRMEYERGLKGSPEPVVSPALMSGLWRC